MFGRALKNRLYMDHELFLTYFNQFSNISYEDSLQLI